MKKIIVIVAAMAMLISCALAEGIDLSSMTVDELRALRDQIDQELIRKSEPASGEIIYEDETIRIVYLSATVSNYSWGQEFIMHLTWTNLSDAPAEIGNRLEADAFADGIGVYPQVEAPHLRIQPGVTVSQEITCLLYNSPQNFEITLYNGRTRETYRTLYYSLR